MVKFSDLFEFQKKSKIMAGQGRESGDYPFYTSSSEQVKFFDDYLFDGESLIMGTGGDASIHFNGKKFAVSTDCLVAQSIQGQKMITKCYYYYLKGNIRFLKQGFKGAGLKHISKGYIANLELPEIDYDTQRAIVAGLDLVENLRQKRKQSLQLLDDVVRATFFKLFGDPIEKDKGWPEVSLQDVAEVHRGRFSPRPRNDPSYYGGQHPFIQTGDISNSGYRLKRWSQTLNDKGTKVSHLFNKGTIVIAIVGATIGATAILEIDAYAPDSVVGIAVNEARTTNCYIEYLLRFYRPVFVARAPETARANINLETLRPLKIPLPPINLQKQFSEIMVKAESIINLHRKSAQELDNQFNALMQKYFS